MTCDVLLPVWKILFQKLLYHLWKNRIGTCSCSPPGVWGKKKETMTNICSGKSIFHINFHPSYIQKIVPENWGSL